MGKGCRIFVGIFILASLVGELVGIELEEVDDLFVNADVPDQVLGESIVGIIVAK
jgi:hypothetical protein